MWTLILILTVAGGAYGGGSAPAASIDHVPGFESHDACLRAYERIRVRPPSVPRGLDWNLAGYCISTKGEGKP